VSGDGNGVLDRIDATIEEMCACGCGRPLRADGPSAYWASDECHRNWQGRRATEPAEVYQRLDAHLGHIPAVDEPDGLPLPSRMEALLRQVQAVRRHNDRSGRSTLSPPTDPMTDSPLPTVDRIVVRQSDGQEWELNFPDGGRVRLTLEQERPPWTPRRFSLIPQPEIAHSGLLEARWSGRFFLRQRTSSR
jgi:hypothetical protein